MGGVGSGNRKCDLDEIGRMLRDPALNLREIADKVGLTRERVRQIQNKHFPETPHRKQGGRRTKADYSAFDPVLLAENMTYKEKAAALNISTARIQYLRRQAEKRNGLWGVESLKREFLASLRAEGYAWCYGCRLVKCPEDFHPKVANRNGFLCRQCSSERQKQSYHTNENVRESIRRYSRSEHYREYQRQYQIRRRREEAPYKEQVRLFERIAKRSDDLAEAVRAGDLSLEEAAVKLGLRQDKVRHKATVEGFLRAARRCLSYSERLELIERIQEGV